MRAKSSSPNIGGSGLLPFATAASAAAIFVADTMTEVDIAAGVLYVAVVLMAARFCGTRGIALVAVGCVCLTLLSYYITRPGGPEAEGVANTLISIAAIGLTAFLALKARSNEFELRERAALLDLAHDSILARGLDDVMTYWSRGAEEVFGWSQSEALGKVSYQLLETIFTVPHEQIKAELLRTGRWEGELLKRKKHGPWIVISSRWSLQRDRRGRPAVILETDTDITQRKRAERRQAAQYAVARILSDSDSLADAAPLILRAIGENLEWDYGALWSVDGQAGRLRRDCVWGAPDFDSGGFDAVSQEAAFTLGQGRIGEVWEEAEPVWIADAATEPGFLRASAAAAADLHGAVIFPILLGTEALGICEFFSRQARECDDDQLAMLAALGSQIGQFIRRKRAEEALRESEARFRALVQFSFDVYWESDAQHRFTRQEFAENLADAPAPGSEIGKTRWEVPYLEPGEEAWRRHRETLDAHLPFRDFELARPTPDGGKRYVSVSGLPVFDKAGTFIGYRGVGRHITDRKRAEEALRRSEAEWREVFEHNPVMYFMIDPAGTILSVNGFGASQLGYRLDELAGQSVFKVFFGSDRELVRRNLDLCLESLGQPRTWEIPKIRKDGTTLWVRENAKAVMRPEQGVIVLVACEDITERKRAEEAVQESERRFRALTEHAYDVVVLLDRQGIVLYASPSVERVLGYTPDEIVGMNGFDLAHPDQLEEIRSRFAVRAEQPGSVLTSERLMRHKNGSVLWTENTLTNLLAEPGVHALVLNLRDISERKQAEEALRESEQRFRDYADAASDWFWETGPDHRFTRFSPNSPALAPIGGRSGLGRARWELAADLDEEPEKWRAHHATVEAHEPFRGFTYKSMLTDGSAIYMAVSGKPLFDRDGRFLGYRGVTTDITDAVRADQAERALQAARVELAHIARITTLGELTASIAHEINQPLAAIVTNAGAGLRWLAGESPNVLEAKEAFGRIVKNGNRASDVIRRIRALASKAPIEMGQLDINEVIQEVVALTRSEIARKEIALRAQFADELPAIWGDRVQLQQVILNLVLNAVEAMGDGELRELLIETRKDGGGNILVSVCDSGPGIEQARVERIFEPFYSTKPGGMGIGLSICRSIIDAHEGKIWTRSNTPRGTIFEFSLPIASTASASLDS